MQSQFLTLWATFLSLFSPDNVISKIFKFDCNKKIITALTSEFQYLLGS